MVLVPGVSDYRQQVISPLLKRIKDEPKKTSNGFPRVLLITPFSLCCIFQPLKIYHSLYVFKLHSLYIHCIGIPISLQILLSPDFNILRQYENYKETFWRIIKHLSGAIVRQM